MASHSLWPLAPLPHSRSLNLLEQIQQAGEIQFVTANGPTTVYEGADGLTGFEYELMHRFANYLGVKPRLLQPGNLQDIVFTLSQNPKAVGAAELVINPGSAAAGFWPHVRCRSELWWSTAWIRHH